ncbi:uncharacterized protein N7483_005805, partial [Penicillium malachiteum]|uniref:uncharacterized protein n=1 Tax=Penicillium malachiteum TaxID=1324776 RepID=UPI0025493547
EYPLEAILPRLTISDINFFDSTGLFHLGKQFNTNGNSTRLVGWCEANQAVISEMESSPNEQAKKETSIAKSRTSRACEICRARKVKCNGVQPCSNCWQHGLDCVFRTGAPRTSRRKRPVPFPCLPAFRVKPPNQQPSPVKTTHVRYDPTQLKRQTELRAGIGVSNNKTGSFQFHGPSSHFNFIQRVYQRIHQTANGTFDQQKKAIPGGLQKWGLEPFIFSAGSNAVKPTRQYQGIVLTKAQGDIFLKSYFRIIHPQVPIMSRSDICSTWEECCGPPTSSLETDCWSQKILYMALSLGARVSQPTSELTADGLEKWADYFSSQTNDLALVFQEPSFKVLQFLLLKAMDSLQAMRPNEVYLFLGHAARTALALGINKSQVANGNSLNMHRLRVTFWAVYANERMSALFTGRPSGLVDDHIDVAYPEDLPALENLRSFRDIESDRPTKECAMIRSMAEIGRLAEVIAKKVYSSLSMKTLENLANIQNVVRECDTSLDLMTQSLPPYLHFFDGTSHIGQDWQEVQRAHLGLNFNLIRMLAHRPALVYTSLFVSKTGVRSEISDAMCIDKSVTACIIAGKEIVTICNDVIFNRLPAIRNDASVAAFLVAACVTLLYEIIGPGADPVHAKEILGFVDQGVHCLDQMEHIGPTTGKALSVDVMNCVKEAFQCSSEEIPQFDSLVSEFPWLRYVLPLFLVGLL